MVKRVAVVVYHSSPLAEPGSGDAGGMTIYVRELAEALARRGVHTDIFTRRLDGQAKVTPLGERVRVVGIEAGPPGKLAKEQLVRFIDDFAAGVRAFAMTQRLSYDVVHSHYWQSGVAAGQVARAWAVPLVHSQHTLGLVKNTSLAPGDLPEPQYRLEGEAEVIRSADVLIASTDDEWQQLSCLYGAPHDGLKTIHPGVDHALFKPGDRAAARAELDLPSNG
ncbi:MAG: glycosyltransferase, partial [Actinomycetota bacterium]